ncbi:hypothetical protein [Philodulcilactobacillus myokoensis]|uniref:hypothetical protein n=1 Tax=Philodulcilactobacillus myokoensis TaxID=2929573 RepID=UPI00256FF42A|nr:hypothetical protein [Philodulcilactobacillus myokoensis]
MLVTLLLTFVFLLFLTPMVDFLNIFKPIHINQKRFVPEYIVKRFWFALAYPLISDTWLIVFTFCLISTSFNFNIYFMFYLLIISITNLIGIIRQLSSNHNDLDYRLGITTFKDKYEVAKRGQIVQPGHVKMDMLICFYRHPYQFNAKDDKFYLAKRIGSHIELIHQFNSYVDAQQLFNDYMNTVKQD